MQFHWERKRHLFEPRTQTVNYGPEKRKGDINSSKTSKGETSCLKNKNKKEPFVVAAFKGTSLWLADDDWLTLQDGCGKEKLNLDSFK